MKRKEALQINVIISESAQNALIEQIKDSSKKAIRIVLQGFGWAGPRLGLALDEPSENDQVFEEGPLTFVMEKRWSEQIPSVKIDYKDSWLQKGFQISAASDYRC